MTQARNEVALVMGTIEKVYQPREFSGKLSPGKIVMATKNGESSITVWQLYIDSVRSEKMPSLWENLDFDWIIGQRVVISCKFDKTYDNPNTGAEQHQYSKFSAIEYLDGDPPQSSQTEGAVRTAPSGTEDTVSTKPSSPQPTNQMRVDEKISWGLAWKLAVIAYSSKPPGEWATSTCTYKQRIRKQAWEFYPDLYDGPVVKPVEPEPEEENNIFDEPSDLGYGVVGLTGEI